TQHTNLISTPPHTHPPTLVWSPRRVLVTRSRPPLNGLRPSRPHLQRPPHGLRQPHMHPRLSFAQSDVQRDSAPPLPPRIAYAGRATPAPRMRGRGGAGRGVYAQGWCPPAFSQRWEDVRAGQGATRARAMRETEGAGTLSTPSRPVNRLRKINVK
ncbi:hypothetical protein BJY52DRAFT_1237946, partial [Lactarius psammicola]